MADLLTSLSGLSATQKKVALALLRKKGIDPFRQLPMPLADRSARLPLSFAQQRLWFLWQLDPASPAYNVPGIVGLRGVLDRSALQLALDALVARHEALRTRFVDQDGSAWQQIAAAAPVPLPLHPQQGWLTPAQAQVLAQQEAQTPFDLAQGPLFRVRLLALAADHHQLLLSLHHSVSDGWSIGVLLDELSQLYAHFSAGQPLQLAALPVQYADYAHWQREWMAAGELDTQLDYWRQQLAGEIPQLNLPGDRSHAANHSDRGARQRFVLDAALTAQIRATAQARHATLAMFLLAVFNGVLHRYTGQTDIWIGVPTANRQRTETEGLIGFFVNTQVLRTDLSDTPDFDSLLQRVRKHFIEAQQFQDLPFDQLVEALNPPRRLSHNPLFQAKFTMLIPTPTQWRAAGLEFEMIENAAANTHFDLSLDFIDHGSHIEGCLTYASDLFDHSSMERLAGHLTSFAARVAADATQKIDQIDYLTPQETAQLHIWSATASVAVQDGNVVDWFRRAAAARPQAAALRDDSGSLSFAELDGASDRLVRRLLDAGVQAEVRVALCAARGIDLVIGMLAILKAGGVYVPLDPALPRLRLLEQLHDSGARLLLSSPAESAFWREQPEIAVIPIERDILCSATDDRAQMPPLSTLSAQQAAYMIFTSGSTGRPKAVVVSHGALANYVQGVLQRIAAPAGTSMAMVSTPAADLGHTVLFGALCAGSLLHLMAPERCFDPDGFAQYMRAHQVGILKIVPSHLAALLQAAQPQDVLPLHTLVIGGESAAPALLALVRQHRPGCHILNHYGPTETTVGALTYAYDPETPALPLQSLPVGFPLPGLHACILDAALSRVPVGVPGELYLGGAGVARGYHGQPGLTAERFVPDPFSRNSGARLYRTGDKARYLADGAIAFLGRVDEQIKIRGYRVELGEISRRLRALPGVADAAVIARQISEEDTRLRVLAYYVAEAAVATDLTAAQLMQALQLQLPDYMMPSFLQALPALPLTANGKLDRRALPEPDSVPQSRSSLPRNDAEAALVAIWQEVLKREQVGIDDNFFALGGDSILSLQIIARARKKGIKLKPKQIFEQQTIAGLGLGATAEPSDAASVLPLTITPVTREQSLPMSYAQQRLWFLWAMARDSHAYNLTQAMRLRGALDVPALQRSFDALLQRHESLRTTFEPDQSTARQHIRAATTLSLLVESVQEIPVSPSALAALGRQLDVLPFDLQHGPMLRANLFRLGSDDHVLVISMHHISGDGWSVNILFDELVQLYAAHRCGKPAQLPALPIQYADFAVWQRQSLHSADMVAQRSYWLQRLGQEQPLLNLPFDHARPAVQSGRGARVACHIDAALTVRLRELARQSEASLSMVLLSAFAVLMHRYSGETDLRIGLPVANRRWHETEFLVGFFVNMLVLRSDLGGNPRASALLAQIRTATLEAQNNQDYPFELLVEALQPVRSLSHAPLFQVAFNHQVRKFDSLRALEDLQIELIEGETHSTQFDLILHTNENQGRLDASFAYSTDLFDAATIERMTGHWLRLLQAIVDDPEQRIGSFPMLADEARSALLAQWNPARQSYVERACLHELIEAQAAVRPDAVAVTSESNSLSYHQLNSRANQLARRLRALGVGPESLVGVALERGPDMIVSLLAVLKAGGAYLPLDPAYPAQRLAYMLEDAKPAVLITQAGIALDAGATQVLAIDESVFVGDDSNLPKLSTAANLAYCIYTSGSTGQPKGALLTHRHVTRLFQATQAEYGFNENDVWSLFHSYAFDFSVWEIFGALLHGGRLVIVPYFTSRSPQEFYRLLLKEQVTVLNQTPSAFRQLIPEAVASKDKGNLRLVVFGGEALDVAALRPWFDSFGEQEPALVNMYGITETTVHVTYRPITQQDCESSVSPIGMPLADLSWYVLDEQMQPVAPGVAGELYIGGAGLARGYLNRAGLTAERFVPDPYQHAIGGRLYRTGDQARWMADGSMHYLGRSDRQVKLRGFRIELGEIEARIKEHPQVSDAVVAIVDGNTGQQLIGYIVANTPNVETEVINRYLAVHLPVYMLPSQLMVLDAMPLTSNGKIDRHKLPAPQLEQAAYLAPASALEIVLAKIWQEVLEIPQVGLRDNFFELGGHSLLATQVMSRLQRHLGREVPLRSLFEAPTLQALAASIEEQQDNATESTIAALGLSSAPLSWSQSRLWFLWQLDPHSSAYTISLTLALQGELDVSRLQQCFNALIARHASLRTNVQETENGPLQVIHALRTLAMEVVDLDQLPTAESERVTLAKQEEYSHQPFDLQHDPLLRAALVRQSAQRHVLIMSMHHIIADGWSLQVLIDELMALYAHPDHALPGLPIQYSDYAIWQRARLEAGEGARQLAYWQATLGNQHSVLELPTDRLRPLQPSYRGARVQRRLPVDLVQAIKRLAAAHDATSFMVLLASWQWLLHRYTGQSDIRVGVPIANRQRLETEGLIGCFINTQVLRTQFDDQLSVAALLAQVRASAIDAQAHQELPFEQLVEALQPERSLSHHPLFQVMFNHQRQQRQRWQELPGLHLRVLERSSTIAKFDLELAILEDDGDVMDAVITYATDLFDAVTIEHLADHWIALLSAMTAQPQARLSALPMLSQIEVLDLCADGNASRLAYPEQVCVHALFERQVAAQPQAPALTMGELTLSYAELNSRANRLARHLRGLGVGPEQLVGIALERSVSMIVSVLAVLKAGAAYVPLDPAYPQQRLAYMLEDAKPRVLITQNNIALAASNTLVLNIDEVALSGDDSNLASSSTPANLAYCIYTSGSTGQPKGVMVQHGSVVNFLHTMAQAPGLQSSDRILGLTSLSFDIAVLEIYLPLMQGAQLVLASRAQALDPQQLLACIATHDISVIQATPSTWRMLIEHEQAPLLQGRTLLCGGEALPPDLAQSLLAQAGQLWNVYGPTETTVWSARYRLDQDHPQALIGGPIGNTQLHVLDSNLNLVPVGVAGELYIGGAGLARGYYAQPGLTAQRFIADPFHAEAGRRMYRTGDLVKRHRSGAIEYLGRIDQQIKLRGFRIELGEIEARLNEYAALRQAVVALKQGAAGPQLVAYVVANVAADTINTEALRQHLSSSLPDYMLPSQYVQLEAMPMTANGKIDRNGLPDPVATPGGAQRDYVAPRSALESQLAHIWQDVLGLPQVGIHDNFFRIGGHSLLAVRVVARVRSELLVELSLRSFFAAAHLADLAQQLAASLNASDAVTTVASLQDLLSELEAPELLSSEFVTSEIENH